jgi:hypothetical protein
LPAVPSSKTNGKTGLLEESNEDHRVQTTIKTVVRVGVVQMQGRTVVSNARAPGINPKTWEWGEFKFYLPSDSS